MNYDKKRKRQSGRQKKHVKFDPSHYTSYRYNPQPLSMKFISQDEFSKFYSLCS